MFGFRSNNTTIRPPAVVTTLGQLKQQYEDPDWSHPPQLQQHAESRGDQYNYDRGIDDIRDMPLSPQQQQFMLSREGASYMAAIKAVDESMYSDGRGGTTVLRGLWKVFDSVVSELGTELTATLANKAIVEANAMQENLLRQGRKTTNLEKKADALRRKKSYEADLKTTMLRLRGTFADVILGTKKELQNTIDKSFAAHTEDMEKSFAKRMKEAEKKVEQKLTKKAIAAEHSFAQQLKQKDEDITKKKADMERSYAKKKEEMQVTLTNMIESNKATTNIEMNQLRHQLNQAEQAANMAQTQLSMETQRLQNELMQAQTQIRELDQSKNMAHIQLTQERDGHYQMNMRLREKETQLHEVQERLQYIERERQTENEISKQHWMEATDRANALQHKLDYEVNYKSSLNLVQKEMEKHLSLESERADLLQQKLDSESQAKESIIMTLQTVERRHHDELEQVSQDNLRLKDELDRLVPQLNQLVPQLDRVNQDNNHLKNELDRVRQQIGEELERAYKENKQLKNELDIVGQHLGAEVDRASQENKELKNELDIVGQHLGAEIDRASQENLRLESELKRVTIESIEELERATKLNKHLTDELDNLGQQLGGEIDRYSNECKLLKTELEKWGEDNMHLKSENDRLTQLLQNIKGDDESLKNKLAKLQTKFDEQVQVSHASISECMKLKAEVGKLEAKVHDQVIDLEAARMSEAEVEKSLEESLQNGSELEKLTQHLETKLRNALDDCEKIADQLVQVTNEKVQLSATLDERLKEIEAMHKKIADNERAFGQDRKEITGVLAGFDAEMTSAEQKLNCVLQSYADLEQELASVKAKFETEKETANFQLSNAQLVIDTLQEEVQELIESFKKKEEALKKNTSDEINALESQFTNANKECNAQMLKYEADIGVYEEAIQMLRNQVEALQELADSESNNCIQLAKDMELQIEKAKEVTREQTQEELRITMKEELKETIVNELRLDELIHLIEQKTSPDKSVAQPIECIKESATPEIDAAQSIDYIQEYVETKKSVDAEEIDIKKEVECDMFSTKDGHDFEPPSTPDLARDLGRDLDVLLSSIEAQLDVEK